MRKTARVLVTTKCNRKCPGCANENFVPSESCNLMYSITELRKYQDLIITGGEPMLRADAVINFIDSARKQLQSGERVYMYSSTIDVNNFDHLLVLGMLDGITFTVHYEANLKDILMVKALSNQVKAVKRIMGDDWTARLLLDSRLPEKYELSNWGLEHWDMVKWLEWKEDGDCPLPEHETGYIYPLF